MIFNPRLAIHEAFSVYVNASRWDEAPSGMSPQRASHTFFSKAEAGVVIAAIMTLRTYERGCALFLNGPPGVVSMEEFCAFRRTLWAAFLTNTEASDAAQAEIFAISDQLLLGYQARLWDHKTERYSPGKAIQCIAKSSKAEERITKHANEYLDVLNRMDNQALRPVVFALGALKEAEREGIV